MYQTIFALAYYGLFRIGELAQSDHTVLAKNVFSGTNKNKLLFVLFTSKTHDEGSRTQKVKISEVESMTGNSTVGKLRHFCPFKLTNKYMKARGEFEHTEEEFIVMRDHSSVPPSLIRATLAQCIHNIGLDSSLYSFHRMRTGRVTDLFKWGFSLEEIKIIGRWKSNAIYRYLKF